MSAAISKMGQLPRFSEMRLPAQKLGVAGFHEDLRDAAAKLISTSLIMPAISSLHESPLRPTSGPFAATSVEKRFGPLLDQQFADRVAKAGNFKLVDAIVDHLTRTRKNAKP